MPVSTSHNLTVLSRLPEARVLPSFYKATELIASVCIVKILISFPDWKFHILIVVSELPEARSLILNINNLKEKKVVEPLP